MDKTRVRYVVKYNDRTYEHPLHSNKRYFIRNIADVVNVLEYCIMQELKKDQALYGNEEKLYNFNVVRLVNDKEETTVDAINNTMEFNDLMGKLAKRIVNDNRIRQNA
jgi:hypothetical protein